MMSSVERAALVAAAEAIARAEHLLIWTRRAAMAKRARDWPPWWGWEIDLWTHLEERMEDRGFTEVDLRRMLESANGYRRARREGRSIIATKNWEQDWEIINHCPAGP